VIERYDMIRVRRTWLRCSNELATKTTASHVLWIYPRIRQPFVTESHRKFTVNGEHLLLRSLTVPDYLTSERLQETLKQIQENFEWISGMGAGVDSQRAMS
jgi:hypothetical protein